MQKYRNDGPDEPNARLLEAQYVRLAGPEKRVLNIAETVFQENCIQNKESYNTIRWGN